jgi:4-amino-4-deoxy-L-arabinose transferase-like glycosyltransferase
VLLVFVFANGILWAVAVPLWQAPDEPSHFGTIAFIAEHGRLPEATDNFLSDEIRLSMNEQQTDSVAFRSNNRQVFSDSLEGPGEKTVRLLPAATRTSAELQANSTAMHLPPLYYLFGAGIYRLFYHTDVLTRATAVRVFSVLLLTLTALTSYNVAKLAFPDRLAMRLTVPTLVGFQPMFIHIGSVINTDVLAILIFSLVLYLSMKTVKDGLNTRLALAMGIALGAAVLTKPHVLSVAPVIGLALILTLIRNRGTWWQLITRAMLILLSFLATCGWWIYRNLHTGSGVFYTTRTKMGDVQLGFTFWEYLQGYRRALTEDLHRSYWAQFGWLDTHISPVYYDILMLTITLAAFGMIVYWLLILWQRQLNRQVWQVALLTVGILSVVGGWAIMGFVFTRRTGFFMPRQGRYYLPSLIANSALLALGILTLLPRPLRPWGHRALRIGAVLFNFICLWGFVVPRYYL